MSAFSGANSVVIDMIAGERERRSLLPLLISGASRFDVVVGKSLAATVFAWCSCLLTLFAFVAVFAIAGIAMPAQAVPALIVCLISLAFLAAAIEVLVSACCRNVKEANSYLTVIIFIVMGVSMWRAFSPNATDTWYLTPVVGHQHVLQAGLSGGNLPLGQTVILACLSVAFGLLVTIFSGRLFERDTVVYGD